jgi:hypothetical protein
MCSKGTARRREFEGDSIASPYQHRELDNEHGNYRRRDGKKPFSDPFND